jgi:hypothetical protein
MFPEDDDDHRADYSHSEPKIRYIMPFITDGYTDLIKCLNHEWMHGLIDWALDSPHTRDQQCFKNKWDPAGESDHFIMRLINFD